MSDEVNCTKDPCHTDPVQRKLCDIILDLGGMSYARISQARRIAQAIESAYEHMTPAQMARANRRLRELETRWGPMLYGSPHPQHATGNAPEKIAPEKAIAAWLVRRKTPNRILRVMSRAVNFIGNGKQRLGDILDHSFAEETDHVLVPVGYDQFRHWMLEMRVGVPEKHEGKVWWSRGEWGEVWEKVGKELEGEYDQSVGEVGPSVEGVTPSYEGVPPPVSSETGPVAHVPPSYAAKKAAVGAGAKQKVGEGQSAEKLNAPKGEFGGMPAPSVLKKIYAEMARLKAARAVRHERARKKSARAWTKKRRAKNAQAAPKKIKFKTPKK